MIQRVGCTTGGVVRWDALRNVASGHAIEALDRFPDRINSSKEVLEFVRGETRNSRNASRKKAVAFLKKHDGRGG